MLDSETVSGGLIAAISKRAALSIMAHMTPRPSSMRAHTHTHTHIYWGWKPVRGNCNPGLLSKSKMEGETDPAGKGRGSFASANNVGLWVPGLISLAVTMRTTGPGLALGLEEEGEKKTHYELKSVFQRAVFHFTKSTSISRV